MFTSSKIRNVFGIAIFLPVLLLILNVGGCSKGKPESVSEPIIFIGVDSADWTWVDPLMDEGRMPHLASLIQRGVRAPFLSLVPLQKSPTIWTTIATGKRPVKHGVADFIQHDNSASMSSIRTAAAFWEILGELGRKQAVLGWWVTYPALPLNGVMVSDFVPYFNSSTDGDEQGVTWPDSLWAEIRDLRVLAEDVPDEEILRFVDREVYEQHREETDALLEELRSIYAADQTYRNMARHLHSTDDFQVFSVYFRGLDMVCHSYWNYFKPEQSGYRGEAWKVDLLKEVVPRYYEYCDELVGEILGYVDPDARIIVCSDHGFYGYRRDRQGPKMGVQMHRDTGILVMAGPDIRQGSSLEKSEVKDIMPTMLAMSGIPLSRDLDGHLLGDAFEPSFQNWCDELLTHAVDSYEGLVPRESRSVDIPEELNAEILEQLKSLGYIE